MLEQCIVPVVGQLIVLSLGGESMRFGAPYSFLLTTYPLLRGIAVLHAQTPVNGRHIVVVRQGLVVHLSTHRGAEQPHRCQKAELPDACVKSCHDSSIIIYLSNFHKLPNFDT